MSSLFSIKMVFSQIPDIIRYLPVTLELAILSMAISLILGLLIALIKIKNIRILKTIANIFISIMRGTPLLVQLYVAYFGIPIILKVINLKLGTNLNVDGVPNIVYALVALSLNESAFNAEIIRAALGSVDRGQLEAANALGMTSWQSLRRVVIPEAFTVALPSLVNSFISLLKSTSLAFTCAVIEMTAEAKILGGRTFRYFEAYVALAIIYWCITFIIEQIMKRVEKKMAIPEDVPRLKTTRANAQ